MNRKRFGMRLVGAGRSERRAEWSGESGSVAGQAASRAILEWENRGGMAGRGRRSREGAGGIRCRRRQGGRAGIKRA